MCRGPDGFTVPRHAGMGGLEMSSNPAEPPGLTRRRLLGSAALAATGALALTAVDLGAARPARAAGRPTGLDANTDPDPGGVAAAGYTFLSYDTAGPGSMTAAKVAACAAHGVAVYANSEYYGNPFTPYSQDVPDGRKDGRGPHDGGRYDAQTALADANNCGLPASGPFISASTSTWRPASSLP